MNHCSWLIVGARRCLPRRNRASQATHITEASQQWLASFLIGRFPDKACARKQEAVPKAVEKNNERTTKKAQRGISLFAQGLRLGESRENVDLERVFSAFDEDPEIFQKNWLRPLLAAGLDLDRACEVVLES